MIARVAEGRDQLLTVLTTCDMVFTWLQTRLKSSTTAFYSQCIGIRQKSEKRARDSLRRVWWNFFENPLDKRSEVCHAYAPEEERAAGQASDVLDIPTSAPHVRGRWPRRLGSCPWTAEQATTLWKRGGAPWKLNIVKNLFGQGGM